MTWHTAFAGYRVECEICEQEGDLAQSVNATEARRIAKAHLREHPDHGPIVIWRDQWTEIGAAP